MRLLLDTQVYLWILDDSPRLSPAAKEAIEKADTVFVSAASIWEATIKIGLGKLEADPEKLVDSISASGFSELPVSARHASLVGQLTPIHRDPFDRLLVAQALFEPLRLLTADNTLKRYAIATLSV
jgi:PIN domain nuclease of toxin-antitoxin system